MSSKFEVNDSATISLAGKLLFAGFWVLFVTAAQAQIACDGTITANVVVLDSPTVFNRLGAQNPNWITYALERDVVVANRLNPNDPANGTPCSMTTCTAGNVELRPDKRPRPLVVRSVAGACLTVNFTNLLTGPGQAAGNTDPVTGAILGDPDGANPNNAQQDNLINNDQVKGRCAGFHATGTELVSIDDDGSMVGNNYPLGDVTSNCGYGDQKGSLVGPNGTITYHLYTPHEGAFTINSYGATLGSEASSGNTAVGMFGALNVQPTGSRIYRSQVTEEEMRLATVDYIESDCTFEQIETDPGVFVDGDPIGTHGIDCNPGGQPIIDYEAVYPGVQVAGGDAACETANADSVDAVFCKEGKAGLPILNMLNVFANPDCDVPPAEEETVCDDGTGNEIAAFINELVHGDINAIIAGPNSDGTFPEETYPLTSDGYNNPQLPNRLEPFREFTSIFHDEQTNSQVFPMWYNDPVLGYTLAGVKDQFMINSGSGGIGSEIIANRLHTGPMHDCTDCAYEEFFLSSSTVGDPAQLVNFPANTGIEQCDPTDIDGPTCWRDPVNLANGPVAFPDAEGNLVPLDNFALYQEDPSNVHHAYTGDFTKIRNTHAGSFEQHIFHLHNHQWLFNPNDDNANYLDAQEIMPGSGHTYELVNGGVGNRNRTVGDAIFHCHFYPHFAQGMWYHIRIKDVFEKGTVLAVSGADDPQNPTTGFHTTKFALRSGKPAVGARALPDGELPDGVPIPAIVPLPGKAMPQMPAIVQVAPVDRGGHSLLGGRTGPDGIPDSSQAFVDRTSVAGADGILGDDPETVDVDEGLDDVSPGFPFWLAGNECGPEGDAVDGFCPNGIIGQRMPTPPLDMLTEAGATENGYAVGQAGGWDGGLPRHSLLGYVSGGLSADTQSRLDFRKVVELAQPVYFPEIGTDLERVSMAYHAVRERPSAANHLTGTGTSPAEFILNGAPAVPGGPFQDPCIDDKGLVLGEDIGAGQWFDGDGDPATFNTVGTSEFDSTNPRTYKLANIQIDAVFNKVGHHYPQERIIALWEDVEPTINKLRPPQPLVMRFNTFDCGRILHTNLVPHEFELDDFQVRTPTDIIGQHIHLPKWDLTTGDGAANGYNYEDGALSPGIVQERIHAINEYNEVVGHCVEVTEDPESTTADIDAACTIAALTLPGQLGPIDLTGLMPVLTIDTGDPDGTPAGKGSPLNPLVAEPHPFFGSGMIVNGHHEYEGARTVIQRILIDPVVNIAGVDRGLGLTFSHDHYGPSTFQQIGLYSTILAEPAGSTWVHNESGEPLYGRPITMADGSVGSTDGGPTSWQAAIFTTEGAPVGAGDIPDHREFYFEMSDFQHAYEAGVYVGADEFGRPKPPTVINQPDPFNVTVATAPLIQDKWQDAINPPLKLKANGGFPDVVTARGACPGPAGNFDDTVPRPCAEAINIGHSSTWVVNYRNEPVSLRLFDPGKMGPDGEMGAQTDGPAGDLALAFQTRTDRKVPQMNESFGDTPYPNGADVPYCVIVDEDDGEGDLINCDRRPGDPFTPIMRAYEGDEVKVKIQVGATEEQHQTTVHGIKWLSNGSAFGRSPNSGWRNFQSHGISEQFSLQAPLTPTLQQAGQKVDYLVAQDATRDGIWMGTWGLLRTYGDTRDDLVVLDDNSEVGMPVVFSNANDFTGVCPKSAPVAQFDLSAVLANEVLPNNLNVTIPPNTAPTDNVGGVLDPNGGTLVYNRRGTGITVCDAGFDEAGNCLVSTRTVAGPLNDPTAMMYVRTEDLISVAESTAGPECFNTGGGGRNKKIKGGNNTGQFDPTLPGCTVDITGCETPEGNFDAKLTTCPVVLRPNVPVEPLVLRANAGDCIDVTLRNRLINEQAVTAADTCSIQGVDVAACEAEGGQIIPAGAEVFFVDGSPVFSEDADGTPPLFILDELGSPTIPVAIADVVFDLPPDLAGWQDMMWVVERRIEGAAENAEMYFFNNNLVRPGSWAGIHPQLLTFDMSRDDGVAVGSNQASLAAPGGTSNARYYAGEIQYVDSDGCRGSNRNRRCLEIVATPIEFGGTNLLSADRVKQPQKGLFGALVIEPQGATYPDALADFCTVKVDNIKDCEKEGGMLARDQLVPDGQMGCTTYEDGVCTETDPFATRLTRAQVTVTSAEGYAGSGGTYREALAISHRIANLRWADGTAVANVHQGELGREGAEDSGHAGFNYGMEPSWFRFQLPPDAPFGNAGTPNSFGSIPNVHAFYANGLVATEPNAVPFIQDVSAAGDPATPVFRATADTNGENPVFDTRIHLLNGASADRDGTFILHGHLWQRDPYVCPWGSQDWYGKEPGYVLNMVGRCDPNAIASQALGFNPMGKWMGSEEGMGHVYGYWPILFDAGGTGHVVGDYLFRDFGPSGNRNGQFGILRVE
jgi:hypothetical protein